MQASWLAFCESRRREISLEKKLPRSYGVASKRPATASGCGGAGPSAASPLLPDAQWHRLRRGSLHPTPRRSQRRLTPFFSSLLGLLGQRERGLTKDVLPAFGRAHVGVAEPELAIERLALAGSLQPQQSRDDGRVPPDSDLLLDLLLVL